MHIFKASTYSDTYSKHLHIQTYSRHLHFKEIERQKNISEAKLEIKISSNFTTLAASGVAKKAAGDRCCQGWVLVRGMLQKYAHNNLFTTFGC